MRSEVALVPVTEADKPVLGNLLQLYRYDMSEFRDYELTEHGTFVYRFLDHYWTEPGRHPFFIRDRGALAGFALVRQIESGCHEIAEFFVLRRHRGGGVGRAAAAELFRRFPGEWKVFHDDANTPAGRLWSAAISAATAGHFEQEAVVTSAGYAGQEYRFVVAATNAD